MIDLLWQSLLETLVMTGAAGCVSFAVGLPLGPILVATNRGGVWEHIALNRPWAAWSTPPVRFPSSSCSSR